MFTLDDVPGAPEAGANVIGPMYARILDMARDLGVPLESMRPREPVEYPAEDIGRTILHLEGNFIRLSEWPDHPLNPFRGDLRTTAPWDFRSAALNSLNPLKELDDWYDPKFSVHDISVAAALSEAGFSDRSIALGVTENQGYGNSAEDVSALHIHQLATWATHQSQRKGVFHVKGGNMRLPEAMGAAFRGTIRLNTPVTAIRSDSTGVEVHTQSGDVFRARTALVTLPFCAARLVKFDPPLRGRQAEAVNTLNYSTTTQILLRVDAPYWEQDGLPPTMWTDTSVGQLLAYPYGPQDDVTSAAIWLMGADAILADRYEHAELIARSMAALKRIRPAAEAALTPLKVWSWQRDPYAGGTWASWGPGQISRFASDMARPHGRIHFAGEHTARLQRGMEGALESGERAALEILLKLS